MANAYDWSGWNIGSPITTDPHTGMPSGFGVVPDRPAALGTLEDYWTPQDDWSSFMSQAQPFWSTRAPMADIGRRLQARYLLAAPGMAETAGMSPSFGQFLSDYPGRFAPGDAQTFAGYGAAAPPTVGGVPRATARTPAEELAELRLRAGQAAEAATTAPGAYMADVTPESEDFRRRAWLSSQFGAGAERASENQQRVANLLALQRGSGGAYRGRMADAIRGAMGNLYQQRQNVGAPRENFLQWYLDQTKPAAATGG